MKRVVPLILILIFAALPVMPRPQMCCMRVPAAMHPCCPATATRAPIKATVLRVDLAPPAAAPQAVRFAKAPTQLPFTPAVQRTTYWQPLATIQLRI